MAGELFEILDAEQCVNQATVTHIDLRGLHETLADIAMKGRKSPDQQEIAQEVDIACHRLSADLQGARQLRGIRLVPVDNSLIFINFMNRLRAKRTDSLTNRFFLLSIRPV